MNRLLKNVPKVQSGPYPKLKDSRVNHVLISPNLKSLMTRLGDPDRLRMPEIHHLFFAAKPSRAISTS